MTDAHRVETLERQILLHEETRGQVAEMLAYEVIEHARSKAVADVNPTSEPEPVPVETSTAEEKDEDVELVRMGPSVAEDVPAAADDQPVPEPEPEAVEPEPEPEPELPPVADHVAEAARRLSIQIWGGVSVPRAQLAPTNDQALAHAVAMEWLTVAGELIVRGGVDPRPVSVTRIPNS